MVDVTVFSAFMEGLYISDMFPNGYNIEYWIFHLPQYWMLQENGVHGLLITLLVCTGRIDSISRIAYYTKASYAIVYRLLFCRTYSCVCITYYCITTAL